MSVGIAQGWTWDLPRAGVPGRRALSNSAKLPSRRKRFGFRDACDQTVGPGCGGQPYVAE